MLQLTWPPCSRVFQSSRASCSNLRLLRLRQASSKAAASLASSRKIDLADFPPERIRSFAIIAHIDHGKTTLADRLLEKTGCIPQTGDKDRKMVMDKLKVERERGITVQAQTASMIYHHPSSDKPYLLQLLDTPGHVDFSSEVHRSLLASQGALLLVDATQGIQAQTLTVLEAANNIETIIGVLNKIDLPNADPDLVQDEVQHLLGEEKPEHVLRISAKTGQGVEKVLSDIVERIPPPSGEIVNPLRALVFDSYFDEHRGVVSLVSVIDGKLSPGDKISFVQTKKTYTVAQVGILSPDALLTPEGLGAGQVGWITCGMKQESDALLGDTLHHADHPTEALASFKPLQQMVYAGFYPTEPAQYLKLDESVHRLALTDRAVSVNRESSAALGQGLRLGFLGALHMDVFRQRLEDDYAAEVVVTKPFVPLNMVYKNGEEHTIHSATDFPDHTDATTLRKVLEYQEPMVSATILSPDEYTGAIMNLCTAHRGQNIEFTYLDQDIGRGKTGASKRVKLVYSMPLSSIITTFHSTLKSITSGFASLDYENAGFERSDLVKLLILVNGKPVDALNSVVHRSEAEKEGRAVLLRLKELVARQQFEIILQASVGSRVIARERISPVRKDVTAGLYGGHYERKMKHLQKQKEGKKKLKRVGSVELPAEAFFNVLSR